MCRILLILFIAQFLSVSTFGQTRNGPAFAPAPVLTEPPPRAVIAPPFLSPEVAPTHAAATPKVSPKASPVQSPAYISPVYPSTNAPVPVKTPVETTLPPEVPSTASSSPAGSGASFGPSTSLPEIANGPVADELGSSRSYAGRVVISGLWLWAFLFSI